MISLSTISNRLSIQLLLKCTFFVCITCCANAQIQGTFGVELYAGQGPHIFKLGISAPIDGAPLTYSTSDASTSSQLTLKWDATQHYWQVVQRIHGFAQSAFNPGFFITDASGSNVKLKLTISFSAITTPNPDGSPNESNAGYEASLSAGNQSQKYVGAFKDDTLGCGNCSGPSCMCQPVGATDQPIGNFSRSWTSPVMEGPFASVNLFIRNTGERIDTTMTTIIQVLACGDDPQTAQIEWAGQGIQVFDSTGK